MDCKYHLKIVWTLSWSHSTKFLFCDVILSCFMVTFAIIRQTVLRIFQISSPPPDRLLRQNRFVALPRWNWCSRRKLVLESRFPHWNNENQFLRPISDCVICYPNVYILFHMIFFISKRIPYIYVVYLCSSVYLSRTSRTWAEPRFIYIEISLTFLIPWTFF